MPTNPIRTHGAYLLSRVGATDEEIAARVGCSRPQVTNYRACKLKPRAANRAALKREFGIPEPSWDEPVPPPVAPKSLQTSADTSINAAELQRFVNDLVRKVNADPESTPHEQAKVLRSVTSTLQLLGKLTGETNDISEAKILRLPAWQRLRGRMLDALKPWPEALRALGRALREEP